MYLNTIHSNNIKFIIFAFIICSCCILYTSYLILSNLKFTSVFSVTPNLCYFKNHWEDGKTLPDVDSDINLKFRKKRNIFFLETSCSDDGIIRMNPRQACAVESAG